MTLLLVEIMIHYFAKAGDFRNGDFSAPAVQQGLNCLCEKGMLTKLRDQPTWYEITEKGRVYVEFLRNVPTPTKQERWVIKIPEIVY